MGRTNVWVGCPRTGTKALVALACILLVLSIGWSAERSSAPSDSHKVTKKNQGPTREESRSASREDNDEASKPAPNTAEQGAARRERKPVPQPKPKSHPKPQPDSEPKRFPAVSKGHGVRGL